ncbi:ubiquitin-protein ligase peroxin 12 [Bulinus truncatus]|nr:ubiquitin-protein ligase peroxin 12 [Bulinus truncatus]
MRDIVEPEKCLGSDQTSNLDFAVDSQVLYHTPPVPMRTINLIASIRVENMAEHGAHLTSSVEVDARPNVFEVLAQQSLMSTIRPAIKHAVRVFAEKYPHLLGKLYQYYDEIYLILDTLIEAHYLKKYGASFAENFYDLRRAPSSQPDITELSARLQLRSLVCLTLLPYILQKCENLFEELKYKYGNSNSRLTFLKKNLTVKQRLVHLYMSVYPFLHSSWEALSLLYTLSYMFHKSRWHHPFMHLSGTELCRVDGDQMSDTSDKTMPDWSTLSLSDKLVHLTSWLTNTTATCLSNGLSVGIFFLQFLEWWYSSDSNAPSLTALPVPPPPEPKYLQGVKCSVCPLCLRQRTNSTALTVSGYVFCFPCIAEFLEEKHCCPITGYPAHGDHLVKLYEDKRSAAVSSFNFDLFQCQLNRQLIIPASEVNGVDEQDVPELPEFMRKSPIEVHGWRVYKFVGVDDTEVQVERIRKFNIRDDDVLIIAYPKCGTHWLWEVTHMLLRQTTDYDKRTKEQVMLESLGGLERSEMEPSPRILNSHHVFPHLPQEIISKKTKIIHIIRNPKDVIVSLYWHMQNIRNIEHFKFETLVEAAMADVLSVPSQFDFLHQMSEFEFDHPDHPIKHVYFEEMKKEPTKIIKELARFLNVPASEELCQNIADACCFENMKKIEETKGKIYPQEIMDVVQKIRGKLRFYRKGQIGDWKNHFTVSLNERFDEFIDTAIKNKQLKLKFIYG